LWLNNTLKIAIPITVAINAIFLKATLLSCFLLIFLFLPYSYSANRLIYPIPSYDMRWVHIKMIPNLIENIIVIVIMNILVTQ
jgi:hypothetical protein